MYADFEADDEFDTSGIGEKTTKTYMQNLVYTECYIVPELHDVLQNGYFD